MDACTQCIHALVLLQWHEHTHAFAPYMHMHGFNSCEPGTDRTNVLESPNAKSNYPTPWESSTMFNNNNLKVFWVPSYWSKSASAMQPIDVGVAFATAGNFQCFAGCAYSANTLNGLYGALMDPLLNSPSSREWC